MKFADRRSPTALPLAPILGLQLLPNLTVSLVKTYQGCSSGASDRITSMVMLFVIAIIDDVPAGSSPCVAFRLLLRLPGARHRHMAALPSTHTLVAAADDQVNALSCYPSHVAAFRYSSKLAPRRVLTKPAEPAGNSG